MATQSIYALSDIHDDLEALTVAADYIGANANTNSFVAVLGDLSLRPYTREHLEDAIRQKDPAILLHGTGLHNGAMLADAKRLLDGTKIPYYVLPGNYDPDLSTIFPDQNLHAKSTTYGSQKLTGFGGANMFPQHILQLIELGWGVPLNERVAYAAIADASPDILLLHQPPLGCCDLMFNNDRGGSQGILAGVKEVKPALVLCGHIHESGPLGNNPKKEAGVFGTKWDDKRRTLFVNPGNLGRFEAVDYPSLKTAFQLPYGTFARVDIEEDGTPQRVVQYFLAEPGRKIGQVRTMCDISLRQE